MSKRIIALRCVFLQHHHRAGHIPRQQRFDLFGGPRLRESGEDLVEIPVRFDLVGLGGFDEAEKPR